LGVAGCDAATAGHGQREAGEREGQVLQRNDRTEARQRRHEAPPPGLSQCHVSCPRCAPATARPRVCATTNSRRGSRPSRTEVRPDVLYHCAQVDGDVSPRAIAATRWEQTRERRTRRARSHAARLRTHHTPPTQVRDGPTERPAAFLRLRGRGGRGMEKAETGTAHKAPPPPSPWPAPQLSSQLPGPRHSATQHSLPC
jgi:hypothetical protein